MKLIIQYHAAAHHSSSVRQDENTSILTDTTQISAPSQTLSNLQPSVWQQCIPSTQQHNTPGPKQLEVDASATTSKPPQHNVFALASTQLCVARRPLHVIRADSPLVVAPSSSPVLGVQDGQQV